MFIFAKSQSLKDQGKSRTKFIKLQAELIILSQSLKDQGKSRTGCAVTLFTPLRRNPLKIRASLGQGCSVQR